MTVSFVQDLKAKIENQYVFQQIGKFAGHVWTRIQQFPIYAQDLRVAYPSLVIASFLAFQIANVATRCFQSIVLSENRSEGFRTTVDYLSTFMGFGITAGLISLFVKKAQLPLSPYITVGISVSTVALYILIKGKYLSV